ncbi:hypothetical protein SmJEL517_g00436 [Synchytrium microbalum]|uniref:Uncharacterized protein n=1 Tax=Synchytrium microbalum TaxID=1806994 RepID=A0A507CE77_9FUNG|nr:uncharacterized protein SmJEL517_g00436 [Synchytrium microbalum]TPX37658.1 hypothetical protein SmJEL517_g00436 [Synchytrium microbalum]
MAAADLSTLADLPRLPGRDSLLEKLKTALSLAETLKRENDVYRDNFEHLKGAHTRLQEKHAETASELDNIAREKGIIEQQSTDTVSQLQIQYDAKVREVEELKRQIPQPKQLEVMRLKMAEELEDVHKRKWKSLAEETDRFRDLYHKLRREHELMKTETEHIKTETSTIVRELNASHQEEISNLESKVLGLQESLASALNTDKLRILQRENTELISTVRNQLQEIDQVRAQRDQARTTLDSQERVNARKLSDEITHSKTIASERDIMASKSTTLETELRNCVKLQETLVYENAALNKELDKAKSRIDEILHQNAIETSDLKMSVVKERQGLEKEIGVLKIKLSEQKSGSKVLQETVADLKSRLSAMEAQGLANVRSAREEEWAKLAKVEGEKADVERTILSLKTRLLDVEAKDAEHLRDSSNEISKLKKEIRDTSVTLEETTKQLQVTATEKERLCAETSALVLHVKELESTIADLMAESEALKRGEVSARVRLTSLESSLQAAQSEVSHISDQLEKERSSYETNLDRQRGSRALEKGAFEGRIEALERENTTLRDRIAGLDAKVSSLRGKVKQQKVEALTWKGHIEAEKDKTDKQMREFLSVLQTELAGV